MNVARIEDENGSHIEPPFDQTWDDLTKLRWHAAVVMEDTGHLVPFEIEEANYSTRILGVWVRNRGYYDITVGFRSSGPYDYQGAWDYLNGILDGLHVARTRGDA